MDRWNRKDQNTYTGMNAQRRNRRKPETGIPVRSEESSESSEVLASLERWLIDDEPEKETREEAPVTETTEQTEEPDFPEVPDMPAEEELDKTEETAVPEPEKKEENDFSAAPELPEEAESAEKTETAEETPAAVQGADSRVPAEARRMSAAPYGTVRPEARRPGTRPQNAYRRPPMPEQKQAPVRPRRDVREEPIRSGSNRVADKTSRVRVGYAPGRMSDGMTQQVPVRETAREAAWEREQPMYSRDAKAYLEKRSQPFRTENAKVKVQDRPEHKILRVIVALLVLIGIIITGVLVFRDRANQKNNAVREAPRIISFIPVDETEGRTAPVDLAFTVYTDKEVSGIRLRGENDEDLDTEAAPVDNPDGTRTWIMKMHVESGRKGTAILQVRRADEEKWYDTDSTVEIDIQGPLDLLTPKPGESPEPDPVEYDDDDYYDVDAERAKAEGAEEGADGEANPEAESDENPNIEAEGVTGDTFVENGEEDPDNETEGEGAFEGEQYDDLPTGELRTPEPTPTVAPPTPTPTVTPPLTALAAPEADPSLISSTTVYTSVTKKVKNYSRPAKELIRMPEADEYTTKQLGVMTFRGDNFRRNAAVGTLSAAPTGLKEKWHADSGSSRGTNQTYYGYGWTGQPVIARWSTQVREGSNLFEKKINTTALKEVIIAGMDGNIRFLDLADGEITRNSIKLGYPMRGTPTLHTRGYPFLSVGQFARKMKVKTGKIGLRQYNLYSQKEQKLLDGLDGKYHRPLNDVGSFETSALIDRNSDTLIVAGSNGMLYLESLNSSFDYNAKVLSIDPSITVMNYKVKGQKNTALLAIESSPAAYDKYVYMANMGGVLMCIDTDTLKPVWAVNTGDSVMAAVALDMQVRDNSQETPAPAEGGDEDDPKDKAPADNRELNLYTANMLNNRKKGDSDIQIRRYNALNGKEIWSTSVGVYKGKKDKDDVGAKASPVIGQNKLNDLVYFTVTGLSEEGRQKLGLSGETPAVLIALDKENGNIVWSYGLSSRSESSPIAVYDEEGNGWIIQCEQNGTIHLLEGLTGSVVDTMQLNAEIEASPAAYGNTMVIGTTGKNTSFIYAIELELAQVHGEEAGYEEDTGGA